MKQSMRTSVIPAPAVIPAKAGIQRRLESAALGPRLRGDDEVAAEVTQ